MLTELQKTKALTYFAILDADHDEFITPQDLELVASRLADGRAEFVERASAAMDRIWKRIVALDLNADGKVSREEWLHFREVGVVTVTDAEFAAYNTPIVRAIFECCDRDADGQLTLDDVRHFLVAFGLDPNAAPATLAQLDTDGDGALSLAEFDARVTEFLRSADPAAAGNRLFDT